MSDLKKSDGKQKTLYRKYQMSFQKIQWNTEFK